MLKNFTPLFLLLIFTNCFSQNLLPYNWELTLKENSIENKKQSINLLLSWERQGLSYLSPRGELTNSFHIPKMTMQVDFILEVNLLLKVSDIYINGNYIDGNFTTKFIWSAIPEYKAKKIKIPKEYLNFGQSNIIKISCSDYSYTGGISHNKVAIYPENSIPKSKIELLFDSNQHLFNSFEEVAFKLKTDANSNGQLNLLIRNDFLDTLLIKKIPVKKGGQEQAINLKNEKLPAGFYEVIATLKDQGYTGTREWLTISPTKIKKSSVAPLGFYNYWDKALNELHKVDPQYKVTKVDSLCTIKRDGFVVEMKSIGNATIRGYYFIPKQKKKYAAILNLPGYGYGFEYLDEFLKVEEDVIELAICVRGHGISKDAFETEFPVPGFIGYNICDINNIAYRQIYMDCIRALEFLLTRNEVDLSKIGVIGGSQGGGLALMTAGLMSKQVSACAYSGPFPCDLKDHIKVRTLIEDELKSYLKYYDNACDFEDAVNTFDFLDTKYFAKNIKCPTFYATGLLDDDCPSRLGFSAFNDIKAKKEFKIFPNDSHIGESNWKKDAMSFFKKQFGF